MTIQIHSLFKYLLISTVVFLNGCTFNSFNKPEPKPQVLYIKNKIPKCRYLNDVPYAKITDVYPIDEKYIGVNKSQLRKASSTSKMLRKQVNFYKRQVITHNKLAEKANKTETSR